MTSAQSQTDASQQTPWDERRNCFDFLRLALAVLVIFSHGFPLAAGSEEHEPLAWFSHGQLTLGGLAVDLFFVMSGFLITGSALRSRTLYGFLQKRVARIYPGFVAAALLGACVVAPFTHAHLEGLGDFLLQTLRLREFGYTGAFSANPYPGPINGSLWSIQYEFWCYLGVALLWVAGLLVRRWMVAGLFAAAWAVSLYFAVTHVVLGGKFLGVLLGSPQLWARMLPFYLAGMMFFLYRREIPRRAWLAVVALALLILGCRVANGLTVVLPVAGTYLVFFLAFSPGLPLTEVGRFGDFSYGTYLYAFPVQQMLVQTLLRHRGAPVSPLLLFALATPLTLLCAVASWYGVERRFLRPGRRHEVPGAG